MSLGHLSDSEIKEALALKERLDLIKKQKGCQDNFLNFVEHMWDGFICGRHHKIFAEKLDQLYHDRADGKLGAAATTGSWYVGITSIKTKFPKP